MIDSKRDARKSGDEPSNEIRVTDRRRVYLSEEGQTGGNETLEAPSLKPTYVQELEERTKAAEQKIHEVQTRFDQLRRQLQQETDETRQRLNRAADERAQRETASFISKLLPVLDNLELAKQAAESGTALDQISEGIRQTAAGFENALAAAGVEPIDSVGEQFNPELHEAVDTEEVSPELDGKVVAEYSRGYHIGERLLRPARVKVGRATEKMKTVGE